MHGDDDSVITMNSNGGGIHVGDGLTGSIAGTRIDGNHVDASDPAGEPVSFDGGLFIGQSTFALRSVSVSHNTVHNVAATADDGGFSGTALEFDGVGSMHDVRVLDNTTTAISPTGSAQASNAVVIFSFSSTLHHVTGDHVLVAGNTATARSPRGAATVFGSGILNDGELTLSHSRISGNRGLATGAHPTAQGGGIWNGVLYANPPRLLDLRDVLITHNAVAAPGGTAQGGGIYSTVAFTAHGVTDTRNRPDDCAGAGC